MDSLTESEWTRLRDWFIAQMISSPSKPAMFSFTAGAARDAATAFESAQKSGTGTEETKRLRDALQLILGGLERMPELNEAIVEQVMRGDHTLECEVGGWEADVSSWTAIARLALKK